MPPKNDGPPAGNRRASEARADGLSVATLPPTINLSAAAVDLAEHGWSVFPCRHITISDKYKAKAPMISNGHLKASRNPDQIKAWWKRWPQAMIGAPVPESLLVIDIDPRNGRSLTELESLTGSLPPTLTTWSGRNDGGRHLYYLRPAGTFTSTRLPKGIDLKINGYCIVPPSIHPTTGQPYRWESREPAALPYRLQELLTPLPRPIFRTSNRTTPAVGLVRSVAAAEEGNRNNVLFWAACRAAEDGTLGLIEDQLLAAATSAGESEAKARRTIASARKTTT